MYHRGPDDSGEEIFEGKNGYTVGLAQRRLSILDLSPKGHQPMHSADGRLSVVFNGEIFNYPELKKELNDYPYMSTCDTEVILAAYLKWGAALTDHIHGMFAIAIYDREDGSLYLIRDRIGKKPLYYALDDDGIYFASELKPLMKCPGLKTDIDTSVIPRFLFQQYIHGPHTIYKGIYKLDPGGILHFINGSTDVKKYWDIKEVYARESAHQVTSYEEAKSELKRLLGQAVASRMIADVPIGTFLSGGYDSSLVTAIAQASSSAPVKTFCIGFDVKEYNEAVYAAEIAKYLGTDHTEVYISEQEMYDMVSSIAQYYDEPMADNSQIPSMLVSKIARQKVTVALSGDGGDEFFCGYNIYANIRQAQLLDIPGAIAHGLGCIPIPGGKLRDRLPFKVRVIADNRDPDTKTQIASDTYLTAVSRFLDPQSVPEGGCLPIRYPTEREYPTSDWQVRRMLLDMETYLADDILVKMDRASMKYSLENRCPIMDTAVMEYSFRIPQQFKYHKGDKKHILKDIAYDYIPREMLDRPKKGFATPMDAWLRGPLKAQLTDYCDPSYLKKQGLFDTEYVPAFVHKYLEEGDAGPASGSNYSKLVWPFFIFQQWYEFASRYTL